jgi:hypothetical protein
VSGIEAEEGRRREPKEEWREREEDEGEEEGITDVDDARGEWMRGEEGDEGEYEGENNGEKGGE